MFSFPNFIRRTATEGLRSYFGRHHEAAPDINWAGDKGDVRTAIVSYVQQLPRPEAEAIYADFEQISQLCDEVGQRALRTMTGNDAEAFDALDGNEARGLSVLANNPEGFSHALSIAYAERLHNGRSWSRYFVSQPDQASEAADAMASFEADLKDLFINFDGSGQKLLIESFERPGDCPRSTIYSIFVETPPQSIIEFDDERPQRKTRKPVIEAVVCYDPAEGTLDIVAKGGRPTRNAIGEAFVARLLGSDAELLPVSPRTFDLDRLRAPTMFATDPEDGIKHVTLAGLRLRDLADPSGRVTLETTDGSKSIHALADAWFGEASPIGHHHWRIEQAKLKIVFHPDSARGRENRITLELRAPNGSNLKEHLYRHELISSKYLERWGLVDGGQT